MSSRKLSGKVALALACVVTITSFLTVPQLAAQTETVLYSFNSNGAGGDVPYAALILDSSGNLYGTARNGGGSAIDGQGAGVVFELSPQAGGGWIYKVLHNFNNNPKDGTEPEAALVFDSAGNLYGTTQFGGIYGYGTVFELIPHANGTWSEQIVHNFSLNGPDGYTPASSLILDAFGNLYGTTPEGGIYGAGAAFELSPQAGGGWKEKLLHNFGSTNDGWGPIGLVFGPAGSDLAGNLYGVTFGGEDRQPDTSGTVYELSPQSDGSWKETHLLSIPGASGSAPANPDAPPVFDQAGNLYTTSYLGGHYGRGTVFELSLKAGGGWSNKTLHSFLSTLGDGEQPLGGVIIDTSGNLYGTASENGLTNESMGIVYELTPQTSGLWSETILYDFSQLELANGTQPGAGLIRDSAGNLYGTTIYGGTYDGGAVFEVTP
jgi:uncharacterized repeat protein (TIGR03803 family)